MTDQILVDSREAARLLSVSERTVFKLRKEGKLRDRKVGKSVRFDRRDLLDFAAGVELTKKVRQIVKDAHAAGMLQAEPHDEPIDEPVDEPVDEPIGPAQGRPIAATNIDPATL